MKMIDVTGVPMASSFEIATCGDPECGPHLLVLDEDDDPICQLVIPKRRVLRLIEALHGILHGNAGENQ